MDLYCAKKLEGIRGVSQRPVTNMTGTCEFVAETLNYS